MNIGYLIYTINRFIISLTRPLFICKHNLQAAIHLNVPFIRLFQTSYLAFPIVFLKCACRPCWVWLAVRDRWYYIKTLQYVHIEMQAYCPGH